MKSKNKYAILCGGRFYNINYHNPMVEKTYTSKNFRKVQEVCDTFQSRFPHLKFSIVNIKKIKEND